MQKITGGWRHSPRDIIAAWECSHRLRLEHSASEGMMPRPLEPANQTLALIVEHGQAHEQAVLAAVRRLAGLDVAVISAKTSSPEDLERAAAETEAELTLGTAVIYQAVLLVDGFVGYADFLTRVHPRTGEPLVDEDGRARYEPVDAKLARSATPSALLQTACYADALVRLGHPVPREVHLWLGDGEVVSTAAADLLPLVREYRGRVLEELGREAAVPSPDWGDARAACGTCAWAVHCDTGRRAASDLSLVAEMRGHQVLALRKVGIATVEELAVATAGQRPRGMGPETFHRLAQQARLQVEGAAEAYPSGDQATTAVPLVEVYDDDVLTLLPAQTPDDLYYDIESDPFAEGGSGLEYLHGIATTAAGVTSAEPAFTAFWAHDRASEKVSFEQVVDHLVAAASRNPAMHVYHYAAYEKSALTRLAARHGTREAEVDDLLRQGRLVDLYAVVRRSVRLSTESYSIKKIEPLYMGEDLRTGDVTNAGDSIVEYERAAAARQAGNVEEERRILHGIWDYNRYDCVSTLRLHEWLLGLRGETADAPPLTGPGTGVGPAVAPTASTTAPDAHVLAALACHLPEAERSPEQHAGALLGSALGYYRREAKPFWWAHFDRLGAGYDDLLDDDDTVVLERVEATEWAVPKGARNRRRTVTATTRSSLPDVTALAKGSFALYVTPPDHLEPPLGATRAAHSGTAEIEATSGPTTTVTVSVVETAPKGHPGWPELPMALTPGAPPSVGPKEAVLTALARGVVAHGAPDAAWQHLLARTPPAGPLPRAGDDVEDITAALRGLERGVLAVQGPPGTGKTYVGSRVIARLARAGWRIGVTGQSHKVIENLLDRVVGVDASVEVAKEGSAAHTAWQQPKDLDDWMSTRTGGYVVGGTSWAFARPSVRQHDLDLLVVDEAGQFALVDAVVAGSAADRILLLGDPQQLPQVTQGTHGEPVEVSALGHLLGAAALVDEAQGYLLATTWRMHPAVCEVVSALQYEGVLVAHPRCVERSLDGVPPGVHLVPVDHVGNRTSSQEEVDVVVDRAGDVIGRSWADEDGPPRPLTAADVLVVAPFNRQVNALRRALDEEGLHEVQVGTVDKFQGREAPVVIVSMAASSGEDLPRGMDFLLSRNRLNVSVSRAKWAAYLVHSPALRRMTPTSPSGLVALGAFLGVLHAADAPPATA